MKPIVKAWLKAAYDDILVTRVLADEALLTHMCAFHAQQAVEKTMKAVLEAQSRELPKIHALFRLKTLLPEALQTIDDEMLLRLDELYIEARYPGELGLMPYGKPTPEDARRFAAFALEVWQSICDYLGIDRHEIAQSE